MAEIKTMGVMVSLSIIGKHSAAGIGYLSWSADLEPVLCLQFKTGNRVLPPVKNLLITVYRMQLIGKPGVQKLLSAAEKIGFKVHYV